MADSPTPVKVMVVKPILVVGVNTAEPPSTTCVMIFISPAVPLAKVKAWAEPVVVKAVNALVMSTAPAPDKDCEAKTTSVPKEELTVTAPVVALVVID